MKRFDIVVAADAERGIAKDGDLPWHLPGDLAHFKNTTVTTGQPGRRNAVIMGRKTWDSIPPKYRPLPRRLNVVLSRQSALELPDGVLHAHDIEAALALVSGSDHGADVDRVFVVGGGAVYSQAVTMAACQRVYYTRIDGRFGCDTFFPAFEADYQLDEVLAETEEHGVGYRIEVWTHRV